MEETVEYFEPISDVEVLALRANNPKLYDTLLDKRIAWKKAHQHGSEYHVAFSEWNNKFGSTRFHAQALVAYWVSRGIG